MSPAHMCAGDFAVQRGSARGHRRPARRQGASGACWHYWSQARRRVAVRLCASAACDTLANSRRVHHDATSRRPAPALASLGRARARTGSCARRADVGGVKNRGVCREGLGAQREGGGRPDSSWAQWPSEDRAAPSRCVYTHTHTHMRKRTPISANYQPLSANISHYQPISANYQPISANYQPASAKISQYQPISATISQYQPISANYQPIISQYQPISANISQHQPISANISQHQPKSVNYQPISANYQPNISQHQPISANDIG